VFVTRCRAQVVLTILTMARLAALLSLLVLLTTAHAARAQDRTDRAYTSGPAAGLGYGYENGGLGGHLAYYWRLSDRWHLVPHGGVGWAGGAAVSVGLGGSFGRRHRLVVDFMWAPYGERILEQRTQRPLDYGPGFMLGWEVMTTFGFGVRATVGAGISDAIRHDPRDMLAANLSVLFKPW
jgi:hypothetical protein